MALGRATGGGQCDDVSDSLPMVFLVRHGETAWTLTGQHTGRTDLPLSEAGEQQARGLAPRLADLRFDRVLCSPMQRARRTAELALPHSPVELEDDLTEWDYGAYEGRKTIDIQSERPGWRLFRDGCPGGEMLDAVSKRADRVIGRVRTSGGNVGIVAHREILRILAVRWIGLAAIEARGLLLGTASLSILGYDHDLAETALHAWNQRGAWI